MKLLLVALNAKYIHSNPAVYSLLSYARKYKNHIALTELTVNHNMEEILKEIYKQKADVVAFSCYIWNFSLVTGISRELKKIQPEVKIWYGGPEVSYDAEKCLKEYDAADGIMIGEGEQTFLELAGYYIEGNTDLEKIAGIAFKESARRKPTIRRGPTVMLTAERQQLPLSDIPFPYENMEDFRNRIVYYESSRGCPYSCSYCLSSIDRRVRFRDLMLVKKELAVFLEHRVPQVKFVDRTFNCSEKHAMEIWTFMKEHDNGITNFHFEISADLLTENELELLATLRPGQVQFEIGVQSTNSDTLTAIRRKMDFEKLSRNVNRIKALKSIHLHLDLIAGLPYEGYESFEKSFNDVYRLRPDQLQLGFLKVLKGSFMEEEAGSYGIQYRSIPPYEVLFTDFLNYEDMLRLKGISEMVELYYNSNQFTYSMGFLEHFYASPFKLYEAISEYYESNDIAMLAHSRIKRYEILLDFYKEIVLESIEGDQTGLTGLFEELLTMDLYLREKLKARPAFSGEKPKKEKLKELYDKYQRGRQSIHIEQFRFDVSAAVREGRAIPGNRILLFDYENRDPLTNSARVEELQEL